MRLPLLREFGRCELWRQWAKASRGRRWLQGAPLPGASQHGDLGEQLVGQLLQLRGRLRSLRAAIPGARPASSAPASSGRGATRGALALPRHLSPG